MKSTAIQYLQATQQEENLPSQFAEALFINHDQLNLAVFPPEILARKPLLLFIESLAYATFIPHHKQKLVYILSAQRHFAIACVEAGYRVYTHFTHEFHADGVAEFLCQYPHLHLFYMQANEWDSQERLGLVASKYPHRVTMITNNFFIADVAQFKQKISRNYRLENFYREMRKTTGYLMEKGKPVGSKWNYDHQNRKSLPSKIYIPSLPKFPADAITQEVINLVKNFLPNHFGRLTEFFYAVTRRQALELLDSFIRERLSNFGIYEDAIKVGEPFLFHSVLSLYLNNGLLLPREVCDRVISAYEQGLAPLNSVEGFIRQIIGWREYIRVYYQAMMPNVRTSNHFQFTYHLPALYWTGETEMVCLRDAVSHVLNYGFSHHIQRLMVLSNFSNLTFTNPQELNQWFWYAYVDAYEWVELPNVLGMSTFADGGILASKPYVAGGNYINKMSDCCGQCPFNVKEKTGATACPLNYLYWHFVNIHRSSFLENGRVSLMVQMYDKKPATEKLAIQASAEKFISDLPRYSSTTQPSP